jgi:hypothetical protein
MIHHNPRDNVDSYTGEPYKEHYQSPIPGIQQGRSPFYKDRELQRISEQYLVTPAAEGWLMWRRGTPKNLFPRFDDQAAAIRAMDWCVRNDGSVGVVIHWLTKKDIGPFLRLLDYVMEAARSAQPIPNITPDLILPELTNADTST